MREDHVRVSYRDSVEATLQPFVVLASMHDGEHLDDLQFVVDAVPDEVRKDLQRGAAGVSAENAVGVGRLADRGDSRCEVVCEAVDLLRSVKGLPVLGAFGIAFRVVAEQD